MNLSGLSLVGDTSAIPSAETFSAINPATGELLETLFHSATIADLHRAAADAASAFPIFAASSPTDRAAFLRRIADNLTAAAEPLIARANLETGLPIPRLQGELARTTGQLRLFADLIEEGSWVDARVDEALPERKPLPRPDLRSMLLPLGPVAVFGASNFPLAFSVAGGDTTSALAAGNPVIVKSHPAHPGTSEIAARAIQLAARDSGLPAGVFSLLFDAGTAIGSALVQHPAIKAVAFTGSAAGGHALEQLAAARPEPIPCFAEMGSTNPVFILPGAMRERAADIAQGLFASVTLGSGQFCTQPGVVFVPHFESAAFLAALTPLVQTAAPMGMLTPGIAAKYREAITERLQQGVALPLTVFDEIKPDQAICRPSIFQVSLEDFLAHPELAEEIFGPTTLLVHYTTSEDLARAAAELRGHLTATLHTTPADLATTRTLLPILETKVGRILFNGYPTGVEVSPAMVHGGPFPATSDGRSTSVGTRAIVRFARPVCFQDTPDVLLPPGLQRANPLDLLRLVNNAYTRDPQP